MYSSGFRVTLLALVIGTLSDPSLAISAAAGSDPPSFTPAERAHWSFQSIRSVKIPAAGAADRVHSPVDAFILKRLEDKGLTLRPPASRMEYIRRAKFDLLGLPPTPQEIDEFVADDAADAYQRCVSRLLANPHYGESWGRLWLDLVRFAETAGYNADPTRPLAWKYRDYVIRAFNSDTAYDRFIRQQIAGDELFPDDPDAQIATGYLRMWPDESNASVVAQARQDALNDLTTNAGAAFLGVSIGCAQCHDHKFDPIRQHDFYRLQAFFAGIVPADRLAVGSQKALDEHQRRLALWQSQTRAVRDDFQKVISEARAKAGRERRKRFPPDVLAAIDTPADERTALQRQLVFWSDRQIVVSTKELQAQISPSDRRRLPQLRDRMFELELTRPQPPEQLDALVATEVGGPIPATFLLAGGSYNKPLREVRPGFLSVLFQEREPVAQFMAPRSGLSGRRSALAGWLTDRRNPLVSRVIVNRIWQGHFGGGLVENANDLGTQTPPPSHPELLDWLAGHFMESGWDIKALHRLIMTSDVYRQESYRQSPGVSIPLAATIDEENRLYWHFPRRRLTGEQTRDAILAAAGRLNEQLEGPSVRPPLPKSYPKLASWSVSSSPRDQDRRSVYIFAKRNLPFPLLKAFDLPDMHESCARRPTTIIAPQALALFNGEFVVGCGDGMARCIWEKNPTASWRTHVADAYRIAYGRLPDDAETSDALRFLRTQAAHVPPERESLADEGIAQTDEPAMRTAFADLCHALLNANEFMFVE